MLWFVLFLVVVGVVIYLADKKIKSKYEDKFDPSEWAMPSSVELTHEVKPQPIAAPVTSVKLSYDKKPSVLNNIQRPIFNALHQALAGEYFLLTNINVGDVLSVNANNNVLARQVATKNLADRQFDFVICNKSELRAICVIVLGESLELLLVNACEDAQLPLARFKVQAFYDVAVIRASLLNALGLVEPAKISGSESVLDITDVTTVKQNVKEEVVEEIAPIKKAELTESGIELELCPECSSVMLKRKAKSGASAGKLFWICSTYPKCRGMVPVKN